MSYDGGREGARSANCTPIAMSAAASTNRRDDDDDCMGVMGIRSRRLLRRDAFDTLRPLPSHIQFGSLLRESIELLACALLSVSLAFALLFRSQSPRLLSFRSSLCICLCQRLTLRAVDACYLGEAAIVIMSLTVASISARAASFVEGFAWQSEKTPLTSINFFIGIHVGFIALFALLRMYMDRRKEPVRFAGTLGMAHSGLLTVISAATLVLAIVGGLRANRFDSVDALVCSRTSQNVGLVPFTVWLCFLTKILEFGDVALLILAKSLFAGRSPFTTLRPWR